MPVIMAPNHFGWWLKDDDGAVNRTRWRWASAGGVVEDLSRQRPGEQPENG